jgi:cell division protein FtsZ
VTIISSLAGEIASPQTAPVMKPLIAPSPPIWEEPQPETPKIDILSEPAFSEPQPMAENLIPFEEPAPLQTAPEPKIKPAASAPRLIVPKKKPTPAPTEAKPVKQKYKHAKQEVLQFEPVTRGRFEKSEPTIVEGQDLDVPTFLRKNIRVK